MTTEIFLYILALVGAVIVVSALLSGFTERSNFPQVAVFLLMGLAIGPYVLNLAEIELTSPVLRVVGTVGLALVLFTDALSLSLSDIRRNAGLAAVILGPGTILAAVLCGLAAFLLLGVPPAVAAVLAAALASTDPVLLRGFLRRPNLPVSVRQGLQLETGLNDIVLLPILLIAVEIAMSGESNPVKIGEHLLKILFLGPIAGVGVAIVAIRLLEFMRKRVGVRRDYESIFSLGICFVAFATAESVQSSGFIAAFAAGLTIVALDVELCDCFHEYGETTAEMLLMMTFVLLGGSLIWTGLQNLTPTLVLFALVALAARPISLWLTLLPVKMDRHSKWLLIWFGPRGLSTLLLALVAVFAGMPQAESVFAIASVVVLASIVLHGGSLIVTGRVPGEDPNRLSPEPEPVPLRMSVEDLLALQREGGEVVWLDVRSIRSYHNSGKRLAGAVRLDPDRPAAAARAQGVPQEAWAALFCT
jgi:NhaP-type Na+/H+ or K+/H+ antiporter